MKRKEFVSLLGKGMIGGAAFLAGCNDLVDQKNPNTLRPDSFWKNAQEAKAGVTSVYQAFRGQEGWSASHNWYDRMVPALYRGDDIHIIHDVPAWWSLAMNTINNTNLRVKNLWSHTYTGVFRANQTINNIPDISSMEKPLKDRLVGEAKFLRAYFYFLLVTNYQNVPLILKKPKKSAHYSVAQAPPNKTWAQIESDLKDAQSALPATYKAANQGRVTKGAAMGYLGKAYLYQGKWDKAHAVLSQIKQSGNYDLIHNYEQVFSKDNEFNKETLLEINYADKAKKGVNVLTPRNREEGLSEAGGWYECTPNKWLHNKFQKEKTVNGELDPRMYHTVLWNGSGKKYWGKTYENLVGPNGTKMGWMKYNDAELNHPISQYTGRNDRLLRYSDVLLMNAEAAIRSGGSLSDAISSINKVRSRAKLKPLPSGMSKKEVLQDIEHQRVLELADEGNRWYDLLRWNGSIDGSMTIKQNLKKHGALGAANFDPNTHKYLPIPITEMQTNDKVKQNPGY